MKQRVVLALTGLMLSLGAAPAAAGPAWGPPGWPNQPIDGGHPPGGKIVLAQAQAAPAADSMAAMAARLDALHLVASESFKAMTQANEDAPPKVKEEKLWEAQAQPLGVRIKGLETDEANNNAAMVPLNLKIRQWNADCAGHPLSNAEDAVCGDRMNLLQRQKAPLDQRKLEIEAQARQVMKQFSDIQARWQMLDRQLTGLRKQYDLARARFDAATSEMTRLKAIMHHHCETKPTAEEMAYCGQVDWDGAKHGLPLLTNPPPPFAASAN
jgi:hypothetical protein